MPKNSRNAVVRMWPGLSGRSTHTFLSARRVFFFFCSFWVLQMQTHFSGTRGCFPSVGELFLIMIACHLVQRSVV